MPINEEITQLETSMVETEDANQRVQLISDLLGKYLQAGDTEGKSANSLLTTLTERAEALNFTDSLLQALVNTGSKHNYQSRYNHELQFLQQCLVIAEKHNNRPYIAISYKSIGKVYERIGKIKEAIEHYLLALSLYGAMGDKGTIARVLNSLGDCYYYQDNYALGMEYCLKALALFEGLNDQYSIGIAYNGI